MNPLEWLLSLTDHQLNVLGTMFGIMASGATILGFVTANYARLARRDARYARTDASAARAQTAHVEYIAGEQHTVSVADYARDAAEAGRHAAVSGEATRQEVSDLGGWMKGAGRRRLPTENVPRLDPEESSYE